MEISGQAEPKASASERKSGTSSSAPEREVITITTRGTSRRMPSRSARRCTTDPSEQPLISSLTSDALAFQSASIALRSELTCRAISAAARRRVTMSPPTKRVLCSITTSRPQSSPARRTGATTCR